MSPPTRSSCNKGQAAKGLSLVEVLLVMALVLLVTGLMAGLIREYSQILRFAGGKSQTLEIAQTALARMAGEVTEAARLNLTEPERLRIARIDPARRAHRLPEGGSEAWGEAAWHPFADEHLVHVVYQQGPGEVLQRSVEGVEQQIADNITGLEFSSESDGTVSLSLSTMEGGRVLRVLSTQVFLPASLAP